jgi:hypothetical protein
MATAAMTSRRHRESVLAGRVPGEGIAATSLGAHRPCCDDIARVPVASCQRGYDAHEVLSGLIHEYERAA